MRIAALAVVGATGSVSDATNDDRDRDGEEADEVDEHDGAQARHGDEQAAERRADEPRQAAAGGERGVGRGQLFAAERPAGCSATLAGLLSWVSTA